jgi:hypothetical protein
MINQEFLDALRQGNAAHINGQTLGFRLVFQEDMDLLSQTMAQQSAVQSITLSNNISGIQDMTVFAKGIAPNRQLHTLDLSRNKINRQSALAIADAIRGMPELSHVDVSKCQLDSESVAAIADALATCPKLKQLSISDNNIDSQGAASIANLMRECGQLENLNIGNCDLEADGLRIVTQALPTCRRLVSLDCSSANLNLEDAAILLESLQHSNTPNLVSLTPDTREISDYLSMNRQAVERMTRLLGLHHNDLDSIPPDAIGHIYDILPAINKLNGAQSGATAALKEYLANMPHAGDEDRLITLASLTAQDDQGRSALSNPLTWYHFPTILDSLTKNGEALTLDTLLQENRDGVSYLVTGLATAPDIVIPALNRHGVVLTGETLLDGRHPSSVLQAVISRNAGSDLFTVANWQGGNPSDLRSVYHLLPHNQQAQVTQYHLLNAHVGQQWQAAQSTAHSR